MAETELYEQLKRLGVGRGADHIRPKARRPVAQIQDLLPGELVDSGPGTFFLYRESHQVAHCHGHHALQDLLAQPAGILAHLARDERLGEIDPQRLAFIDTETTGLAGGTGTYAFLVGVGRFEGDQFTIHQFFMRDYHEEPAQLQALGDLLDGLQAAVSFNGKSFDLPLLETRFIMNRQPPRLVDAPHLDLLPAARRIWKYRLESCALSSLETEVLGVRRAQADVPGWLIPSLYADYVRSGDADEMPRIFYHNAQDILSLVTLAARLGQMLIQDPTDEPLPGEDLYGLARLYHEGGRPAEAERAYTQAAQTSRSPRVREMAMRDLATLLKRQERRQEALAWWTELVDTCGAVYGCQELAKHYEWQAEDLARAIDWTRRGLDLARAWPAGAKRRETLAELEHRLERLERKQAQPAETDERS
jgi:uncharacterized protein YprB with RNaseH-like and TPR domain